MCHTKATSSISSLVIRKKGNPNIGSFDKIFHKYHEGEIDSYYILMVNITGEDVYSFNVYMFDILEYLGYVSFDYGTGQMMLKEKRFLLEYNKRDVRENTKADKMMELGSISEHAYLKHIKLKEMQQDVRRRIINDYK